MALETAYELYAESRTGSKSKLRGPRTVVLFAHVHTSAPTHKTSAQEPELIARRAPCCMRDFKLTGLSSTGARVRVGEQTGSDQPSTIAWCWMSVFAKETKCHTYPMDLVLPYRATVELT